MQTAATYTQNQRDGYDVYIDETYVGSVRKEWKRSGGECWTAYYAQPRFYRGRRLPQEASYPTRQRAAESLETWARQSS